MSDEHAQLHAFADGELSPREADAFRGHLATCPDCQAELQDILQLQGASDLLVGEAPAAHIAPVPRISPRSGARRALMIVLPLAAAILLALYVGLGASDAPVPSYSVKGPFGYVAAQRGANEPPPEGARIFLPESTVELRLIPDHAAGDRRLEAALFVAGEPDGRLVRAAAASIVRAPEGAFGITARAGALFGGDAGSKTLVAVIGGSPRALDGAAGKVPADLAAAGVQLVSIKIEYRLTPP